MGQGDTSTQTLCFTLLLEHAPGIQTLDSCVHTRTHPCTFWPAWLQVNCAPVSVLLGLRGKQRKLPGSCHGGAGVSGSVWEKQCSMQERAGSGQQKASGHRLRLVLLLPHSGNEQGRILCSILVLGRCICQGQSVEFILFKTMLAWFVPFTDVEIWYGDHCLHYCPGPAYAGAGLYPN